LRHNRAYFPSDVTEDRLSSLRHLSHQLYLTSRQATPLRPRLARLRPSPSPTPEPLLRRHSGSLSFLRRALILRQSRPRPLSRRCRAPTPAQAALGASRERSVTEELQRHRLLRCRHDQGGRRLRKTKSRDGMTRLPFLPMRGIIKRRSISLSLLSPPSALLGHLSTPHSVDQPILHPRRRNRSHPLLCRLPPPHPLTNDRHSTTALPNPPTSTPLSHSRSSDKSSTQARARDSTSPSSPPPRTVFPRTSSSTARSRIHRRREVR